MALVPPQSPRRRVYARVFALLVLLAVSGGVLTLNLISSHHAVDLVRSTTDKQLGDASKAIFAGELPPQQICFNGRILFWTVSRNWIAVRERWHDLKHRIEIYAEFKPYWTEFIFPLRLIGSRSEGRRRDCHTAGHFGTVRL